MGTLEQKRLGEPPSPHGEWAEEAKGDDRGGPTGQRASIHGGHEDRTRDFHHRWAFLTHPFSAHFSS